MLIHSTRALLLLRTNDATSPKMMQPALMMQTVKIYLIILIIIFYINHNI